MTLTIELQPEIETRLREAVQLSGRAAPDLVHYLLEKALPQNSNEPRASAQEARLLQKINLGIAEPVWLRYRALRTRLHALQNGAAEAAALSAEEYAELLRLTEQVEKANVERVQNLAELARLRQVSLPEVMRQLGLQPPDCE